MLIREYGQSAGGKIVRAGAGEGKNLPGRSQSLREPRGFFGLSGHGSPIGGPDSRRGSSRLDEPAVNFHTRGQSSFVARRAPSAIASNLAQQMEGWPTR